MFNWRSLVFLILFLFLAINSKNTLANECFNALRFKQNVKTEFHLALEEQNLTHAEKYFVKLYQRKIIRFIVSKCPNGCSNAQVSAFVNEELAKKVSKVHGIFFDVKSLSLLTASLLLIKGLNFTTELIPNEQWFIKGTMSIIGQIAYTIPFAIGGPLMWKYQALFSKKSFRASASSSTVKMSTYGEQLKYYHQKLWLAIGTHLDSNQQIVGGNLNHFTGLTFNHAIKVLDACEKDNVTQAEHWLAVTLKRILDHGHHFISNEETMKSFQVDYFSRDAGFKPELIDRDRVFAKLESLHIGNRVLDEEARAFYSKFLEEILN